MNLGSLHDAWLTTQPEEPDLLVPGDEGYPRCGWCGAFLRREPDSRAPGELREHCDGMPVIPGGDMAECGSIRDHGPHEFPSSAWCELHRTCRNCSHDNTEIEA